MPDHSAITAHQVSQLGTLGAAHVRDELLTHLLGWRAVQRDEPPATGGRRRPALTSVPANGGGRVPVAATELLAIADATTAVTAVLDAAPDVAAFSVEDVCGQIRRVVLQDEPTREAALTRLRAASITASLNHVAVMGGTAKGGATPKATTGGVESPHAPPTAKGTGTLVVVIDTGIDGGAANRTDGWSTFVAPVDAAGDVDPLDVLNPAGLVHPDHKLDLAAGHGTFVAGLVTQVDPTAEVVMLRALTTDGVCTEADLVEALCRAADVFEGRGLTTGVVNLSLGFETPDGTEPAILGAALNLLPDDVIVVAAAGNAATGVELWPAASDRVCAVSSLVDATTASTWSNSGPWVDFSARGEGLISTYVVGRETTVTPAQPGSPFDAPPGDRYDAPDPLAVWSGTSFSTPQVAGRFANILASNPGISRASAIADLQAAGTAIPGHGHAVSTL